uniref:TTF-type domain-containing protein n=1 Tax=Seriola lalandi dorsalis TaxID=1841481 RepID=A0A3B4X175_SERLL
MTNLHFPNRSATRSFSAKWYSKFQWLEYSISRDAVFCKPCRHFPEAAHERSINGFKDWKHFSEFCAKHKASRAHAAALGKMDGYKQSHQPGRGNVINQLNNDASQSFIERNRQHLMVVIDLVLFCAKQEIPLRGHRENPDTLNKGNFLELLNLVSKYDPEIKRRLDELPNNGKLLHHDIQNEILEIAICMMSPTHYAILADECKDLSKRELGAMKERAVGFVETANMNAEAISAKILEVVEPLQLDPALCVGFGFDGASVMSGNRGGVHVILKKTFPHAVYVHCNSHRLNLVLCTAAKVSPGISTFFDVINSLHTFMTGAHRHAKFLEIQKQMRPGKKTMELEQSCDVRWSSWSNAVSKVLTLLGPILEALATFSESSGQTKIEADSLLHQMQTKKFLFLLITFNQLFEVSDFATKGLQSSTLSVTDCIDLIEGLKDNYTKFRNENDAFDKVMALTDELMNKHEIVRWDTSGPRKRRLPARLDSTYVDSTVGKSSHVQQNSDLQNIWNDILDKQLMELNSRFKPNSYGFMKATAACMPHSETFGDKAHIQQACAHFSIPVEDAEHTVFVQQLKRKAQAISGEKKEHFPSLFEVLDACPRDIFPKMNGLLRALLTLPMTSCTVERLFSAVKRIKTCTRVTMLTGRLNSLSLLSFEKELTASLQYSDIFKVFNSKPRRLKL